LPENTLVVSDIV